MITADAIRELFNEVDALSSINQTLAEANASARSFRLDKAEGMDVLTDTFHLTSPVRNPYASVS